MSALSPWYARSPDRAAHPNPQLSPQQRGPSTTTHKRKNMPMKTLIITISHLIAVLRRMFHRPKRVTFANIAEGTHAGGNITKAADAAITERFLLAKVGSASDRIAVCGAADAPIGVITDEAAAAGDLVNVTLFGAANSTVRMVASAAIAQGALVEPAANGRVQTLEPSQVGLLVYDGEVAAVPHDPHVGRV